MRLLLSVLILSCFTGILSASCPNKCKCKNGRVSCRKLSVFPSSFPSDTRFINMLHNEFKVLRNFSFKSTPYLQVLHLDHNRISRIEVNAFKGAPDIKYLFLRNNLLGTDKSHLFVNSLSILRNLHHLYLTGNNFKKIPAVRLPAMTKLNLDDNDIEDGDFPKSFSQCGKLQSVVLSSNAITFLNSQSFKYLEKLPVVNLDYEKNNIRDIDPQAFHPIANSIKTLWLDRNQLTGHTVGRLVHSIGSAGARLEILSVQMNSISVLDEKSFEAVAHSKLFCIYLDGNDILKISEGAFSPLTESVRNLTMTKCGLSNQLDRVDFRAMDSLRLLNLSLNNIRAVPGRLPSNVETIDLHQNSLTVIPADAFSACQRLVHLNLRENKISTIAENAFIYSSTIQTLDLAENKLMSIDGKGLFGLSGLRYLDLSHQANGFALDDFVLKGLYRLNSLNLRGNGLSDSLGSDTLKPFADLRILNDLDLHGNGLKKIGDQIFTGLTGLRTLRLSRNMLEYWKAAFNHFSAQLKYLDISRNRLRFVSVARDAPFNGLYSVFRSLSFFDASYNPYNCSCPLHPYISQIKTMGSVVNELNNMRCQSPKVYLQDIITSIEVGGRCTEKPVIFPKAPAKATKPPQHTRPPSTPTAVYESNTALPETTVPSAFKPIKRSTVVPNTVRGKMTTVRPQKHNYSVLNPPRPAARVTNVKQKKHQNITIPITIAVVAFCVAIAVVFKIYRNRRKPQSPIHNIHQKYTHMNSSDDDVTRNQSLQLREDEQSLLSHQEVDARSMTNGTPSDRQFPLLTPLSGANVPRTASEENNTYQNRHLQNGVPSGHSSNFFQPRSIYETTNRSQVFGYQGNIEDGDQTHSDPSANQSINSTYTNPAFIDDGVPVTPQIESVEEAAEVPESTTVVEESNAEVPESIAEMSESTAEVMDHDIKDNAGSSALTEACFQEEGESDDEEDINELDMLCLCSKHDSCFVQEELVKPLSKSRYSPVIHVLRTRSDEGRIRDLLCASRYLLVVNTNELTEDSQATKLLSLCLEEMRKTSKRPGVIVTPIQVFGDEVEHPLLTPLADVVDKGKFNRVVWCRAKAGVDPAFIKKIEEVLCSFG